MIGIVDYGSGNIYAIANIHKRLNIPHVLTSDAYELSRADKLILPGVGAFDETMTCLHQLGLKTLLDELVLNKKVPILGVCVGMQIMANKSEEGQLDGFGWIDANVERLDISKLSEKPHLPHLGWNSIQIKKESKILNHINVHVGFYFLHTYHCACNNEEDILSITNYGLDFTSSFQSNNVFGVQFHPEKSHSNGIEIFRNFAQNDLC